MLRIILNDLYDLAEPHAVNILMEHVDSGPAEDSCRLLQFIGCHELLLIQPDDRIIFELCVNPACIAVFASFRAQAFDWIPAKIAPRYGVVGAVHSFCRFQCFPCWLCPEYGSSCVSNASYSSHTSSSFFRSVILLHLPDTILHRPDGLG